MILSIKLGDITKENVDAIVNAGHHLLCGGGGVDGAIHKAAGYRLLQECLDFPIKKFDNGQEYRCDTGECFVTKGYNLPCKYVIHTVAPSAKRCTNNRLTEENIKEMYECWTNVLRCASKIEVDSVSICSLGTGGHAFPIEQASEIAIKTIFNHLSDLDLQEINIVCFDEKTLNHYRESLIAMSYSEQARRFSITKKGDGITYEIR